MKNIYGMNCKRHYDRMQRIYNSSLSEIMEKMKVSIPDRCLISVVNGRLVVKDITDEEFYKAT